MWIQLISVKPRVIAHNKRQKDTTENVEFAQIISYKTSLLGETIELKIDIFKFYSKKLCIGSL